ncbi:hypothetical protein AQJ91_31160 [Streptomyces dysideae]|uniref:Uncharacterized protein n=1 Tax=Streptomyces dysideae TaxID=909626 RepID=A0A101UUX9_9ACTN|nr:hypothetical protein AQJ91_31160 [Streptomyces dysideae]
MPALAVLSAVPLFVGTLWLWPRLARNQAFGFHASWADLFGQENGQGVIGDSTGGYCVLKLGMHHPEVYAAGRSSTCPRRTLHCSSAAAKLENPTTRTR